MSLLKRTYVSETVNFEFRAEAFNIFNRTCFGGIITDLTRPDFGLPTGPQVGARSVQLVAKINF